MKIHITAPFIFFYSISHIIIFYKPIILMTFDLFL
nr:MAG TPA: hypothetical protein [Caudoviricetes sp.]